MRGVAGSGKTVILAHWAAKMVLRHPARSVLVTFFNKGMQQLLRSMIRAMLRQYVAGVAGPSLRAAREYCAAEPPAPGLL